MVLGFMGFVGFDASFRVSWQAACRMSEGLGILGGFIGLLFLGLIKSLGMQAWGP